ncbi:AAA family ATPase [Arcticibacter eurypsychrophilus]|uniref:AAA family ATPase n=1 Tax=Arcticibacter eurypsychrophilus TaxID=1434752 RepID=UPI00084CED07|nr:AAA family ATPase [Arcticibacter eurypsychrophilus]
MSVWHIQLHPNDKTWGPNKIKEVLEKTSYIGIGEWKEGEAQIRQFKDELKIGNYVIVRSNGPLALVRITGNAEFVKNPNWELDWFSNRRKVEVVEWFTDNVQQELGRKIDGIFQLASFASISDSSFAKKWIQRVNKKLEMKKLDNIVELLKYKKQIILQGPPGTGKTRLAKEIASALVNHQQVSAKKPDTISAVDIKKHLKVGDQFQSVAEKATYVIEEITDNNVKLKVGTSFYSPNFKEIIEWYKSKRWSVKGEQKNQLHPYSAAVAKYIYDNIGLTTNNIESSDSYKLIQFHPSYTYEDFVRGIVAVPNLDGDGILYEGRNNLLAKLAIEALENYKLSQSQKDESKKIIQARSDLDRFIEHVNDVISNNENHKYSLTENVYLFECDELRFKYKGDNWVAHEKGLNMKFSELEKLILAEVKIRADMENVEGLEALTKQHAVYFFNTVEKFNEFVTSSKAEIDTRKLEEKTALKNYVLIIDEINRANLSSVLGELIYALEYRGEEVDSMYEVDGNKKIILPPNLFIIGTMNTADRSVGHIDYAIRRRFAFVDVLPEKLENVPFETDLFFEVSKLFVIDPYSAKLEPSQYLSSEFRPQDVWLGHSYFIKNPEANTALRLKYEIIPVLEEYIKDGVLKESSELREKIESIKNMFP